jgi:hypothetical protein
MTPPPSDKSYGPPNLLGGLSWAVTAIKTSHSESEWKSYILHYNGEK